MNWSCCFGEENKNVKSLRDDKNDSDIDANDNDDWHLANLIWAFNSIELKIKTFPTPHPNKAKKKSEFFINKWKQTCTFFQVTN